MAREHHSHVERIDWLMALLLGLWGLYKTLRTGKEQGYI
jgi:hypothetical protein